MDNGRLTTGHCIRWPNKDNTSEFQIRHFFFFTKKVLICFLFSTKTCTVLIRSTKVLLYEYHNVYFCGEIRKIHVFIWLSLLSTALKLIQLLPYLGFHLNLLPFRYLPDDFAWIISRKNFWISAVPFSIILTGGNSRGLLLMFKPFNVLINPEIQNRYTNYHNNPKYWDNYKLITIPTNFLSGKQCRPWSDAVFCGTWSRSILFA